MYKSSLIRMLSSLNPKEFRELGELVYSPYFNKTESIRKLYDYLKRYYPEFKESDVEKEKAFGIIFQKAEYNDGFMRTMIFNLGELLEEYMRQANIKRDPAKSELILLDELNYRKLEKEFVKNLPRASKEIDKLKNINAEYYYYKFLFQQELNLFYDWSRYKAKNLKGNYDEEMANENKYLLEFSLIKLLANYRNFIYRKELFRVEYTSGFLDEAIKYILTNPGEFTGAPSVLMHLYEVMLLKTKSEKHYWQLKGLLLKGLGSIDERYSLLNVLQEYCIHRKYEGDESYLPERFELYKTALENNFHRSTGDIYLDSIQFASISRTASQLGEYRWAEDFINKYKDELVPELKETLTAFALGRLYFEKGEFAKAVKFLDGVKTSRHLQHKVIIRNLMLMLYYELSWFDKAEMFHASYRQYLSKNEKHFAGPRYERFTDFMKYYSALLKLKADLIKLNNDKTSKKILETLKNDLKENTNVMERDWLIAKAGEL